MSKAIIEQWEDDITISLTLKYPVEDNENKEEHRKWLYSKEGREYILNDFRKSIRYSMLPSSMEIEVVETRLTETEVRSTDTDPRV